jgi:hypothetical protein
LRFTAVRTALGEAKPRCFAAALFDAAPGRCADQPWGLSRHSSALSETHWRKQTSRLENTTHIKNAFEAGGPEGEVALEIDRPAEGGSRVMVLDRGGGMSDEALEGALRPFVTTKPSGSGLGLTLSREIVELHHGRLRLQRREGGGMMVSVWLPDREGALPTSLVASRVRLDLTRA